MCLDLLCFLSFFFFSHGTVTTETQCLFFFVLFLVYFLFLFCLFVEKQQPLLMAVVPVMYVFQVY